MADRDLTPEKFGETYLEFLRVVMANAPKRGPILRDRIQAHLKTESTTLPVFTETFDPHDQPNVQVAMEAWVREGDDRRAQVVGVAGHGKEHIQGLLSIVMGRDDA